MPLHHPIFNYFPLFNIIAEFANRAETIAKIGTLDFAKWCISNGLIDNISSFKHFARKVCKFKRLDIIQYLNSQELAHQLEQTFVGNGWLPKQEQLSGMMQVFPKFAAIHGQLEIIKWLSEHHPQHFTYEVIDCAAEKKHLSIIKWLKYNHCNPPINCSFEAIDMAAENGQLEMVKFLFDNFEDCQENTTTDFAVRGGHLEIVKFLHSKLQSDECQNSIDYAASNGDLTMIKWLHENCNSDDICTSAAMDNAAKKGHLEIVKWLRENRPHNCNFESALTFAIANERGRIAAYLYANMSHPS